MCALCTNRPQRAVTETVSRLFLSLHTSLSTPDSRNFFSIVRNALAGRCDIDFKSVFSEILTAANACIQIQTRSLRYINHLLNSPILINFIFIVSPLRIGFREMNLTNCMIDWLWCMMNSGQLMNAVGWFQVISHGSHFRNGVSSLSLKCSSHLREIIEYF